MQVCRWNGKSARAVCVLAAAIVLAGFASTAQATFNLQVTEIWPGNDPGNNLSEDWFEVTNFGDMTWTAATDGELYFDDNSQDAGDAEADGPLMMIDSIAPGESVIFVDEGGVGASGWLTLWQNDLSSVPQVGFYDGSGLGQSGDGVTLFLDDVAAGVNLSQIDFESYPDASSTGGQSYDVVLGEFSTVGNASGAIATTMVNDEDQPAIGSPGSIPEPSTIVLFGLGALAAVRRRR